VEGGCYFFTVVTAGRRALFAEPEARSCLGCCFREVAREHPFETIAVVLLPDHLHALWQLPDGDSAYDRRWAAIKAGFTRSWLSTGGAEACPTPGLANERRRGVWQRRYWEHTIHDVDDLEHYLDYIHFNPVKHGLARAAGDWPWSSFHKYVRMGHYEPGWGTREQEPFHGFALVRVDEVE